jgi:hypothetical protein
VSTFRFTRLRGQATASGIPAAAPALLFIPLHPAGSGSAANTATFRFTRFRGLGTSQGTPTSVPVVGFTALAPSGSGSVGGATFRFTRLRGVPTAASAPAAVFRFTRLRGQATQPGGVASTFRFTRLRGRPTQSVTAVVTAPATAEPFDTVTIDATGSPGAGAYLFTQTGGPPVVLAGTGGVRSYEAPAGLDPSVVSFTVTVRGVIDATADVTTAIYPVPEFDLVGAAWVPRRAYLL